jgi:hypothetical protein
MRCPKGCRDQYHPEEGNCRGCTDLNESLDMSATVALDRATLAKAYRRFVSFIDSE